MVNFLQRLRMPPRRLVLWHSVAAVPMGTVVLLGAYLSYHYHQLTIENRNRVDHAYEVLDVVDALYISVQDADVAQRDYIITGDAAPLTIFQAALKAERADADRLRMLLTRSGAQETRLSRLETAVSAKLAELGQTISVRRTRGFDAARDLIRHGDGGKAMDDIRQQAEAIGDNERHLLARRIAAGREQERDTLLVGVFIAALSVTTRILIAIGLRWYHKRRRAPSEEPEQQVAAGGR